MLVRRQLGQSSLQFFAIQVQSVVVDILGCLFNSLEKQVDFAQVSALSSSALEMNQHQLNGSHAGPKDTYPLPSSITMAPSGILSAIREADWVKTVISSLVK